jgi:hypothetical protein
LALNSNHFLTHSLEFKYITIIAIGVHNKESHYVDTIPAEQEQYYDQYDIAHGEETIPIVQEQPYDQYDIAHNTET